jgi:long-chain fatty acid transport protein
MKWILAAACLLLPSIAGAAGWSTADRSVIAMGAGGTGAARPDDPGSNSYNPAAGALSEGWAAAAGVLIAAPSLTAEGSGWSAATEGGASLPPHLHLRWSGERLGAGLSVAIPFGSRVVWPQAWPRRFDLVSAELQVVRFSGFAAVRFGDLAFAAGPFVDLGRLALRRSIDFVSVEGQTAVETTATGAGVQLSAFWRAAPAWDLGLAYHSRSALALGGWADFTVPPELRGRAHDQPVEAKVTLPDRLTLGATFSGLEGWSLSADLELNLWSTVDALVIDFSDQGMDDLVQRRDWRVTVTPRLGASYLALPWLTLRGGAFLDPSPVPTDTLGASSPDSTRLGLTLGAGFSPVAGLFVDLGYQLLLFTGATSEAEATRGVHFGGNAHLAGASIAYRFTSSSAAPGAGAANP